MSVRKRWPYIVGSVVLLGATFVLGRQAMKWWRRNGNATAHQEEPAM